MVGQVCEYAGKLLVDVLNPRLARYGQDVGRRLAITILTVIVAVTVSSAYIYYTNVKVDKPLVDQSIFSHANADNFSGAIGPGLQSGVCGTYVNAKAALTARKFPRRIRLGAVADGGCNHFESVERLQADSTRSSTSVWGPLNSNGTVCLAAKDRHLYHSFCEDTCRSMSLDFKKNDTVFTATGKSYFATINLTASVPESVPATVPLVRSGNRNYNGAVIKGDLVYFAPHRQNNVGVLDTRTERFRTIKITGSGDGAYNGAETKGDLIYFVSYDQNNVGVLDTKTERFRTIDITVSTSGKYSGAVIKGDLVYFFPWCSATIGILDTGTERFRTINLMELNVNYGGQMYSGAVIKGDLVYFAPYNEYHVGVLDTRTERFSIIDIPVSSKGKYSGAVIKGDAVYFTPFRQNNVGVMSDIETVHWAQVALKHLRRKVLEPGRTRPCVVKGWSCKAYTCFGASEKGCDDQLNCTGETLNMKVVTRPTLLTAFLQAGALQSYFEIGATMVILACFFSYMLCRGRREELLSQRLLAEDFMTVAMEGDSAVELRHLREGS